MRLGPPRRWLKCRDANRFRHRVVVGIHLDQRNGGAVALVLDGCDVLLLTPLQAGWLRGQLKEAVIDLAELAALEAGDGAGCEA